MSSPSISRPSSRTFSKGALKLDNSFRSSSPTHPVHIEHQIPNHPHIHIHTIRSPNISSPSVTTTTDTTNESAIYDDDVSPPSSISAQILAPFLNAPVPSSFKSPSSNQNATIPNGHTRGANARTNALGSLSRSNSVNRNRQRRSNEDNYLTAQYLDLIGDGKVDTERLEKIRSLASERGVPSQLRKYVWPLLLSQCVQRERMPIDSEEDNEEKLTKIAKRIRGELSRYHRRKNRRGLPSSSAVTPSPQTSTTPEPSITSTNSSATSSPPNSPLQLLFLEDAPLDLAVESTILTFLTSNPDIEYSAGMVYLALTLAKYIFQSSPITSSSTTIPGFEDPNILLRDAFEGALALFGQLPSPICLMRNPTRQSSTVSIISVLPSTEASKFPATHRISQFLSTFRLVMPELASYFDDEGIGGWGDDWVGGWVGWFCAKELCGKINDDVKARLWDVYFSFPPPSPPLSTSLMEDVDEGPKGPGEELHIYVCIALLKSCADALEVLEQSEIRTLLQQLPPVEDVDGILKEAKRIKEKVLLVEKQEEEGYLAKKSSGGSRTGSDKSS